MLKLQFKVVKIEAANCCRKHISITAEITIDGADEESISRRIRPLVPNDDEIAQEIGKNIQMTMTNLGMFPKKRRDPEAMVAFVITEKQFDELGRPTAGDYLDVQALIIVKSNPNNPDFMPESEKNVCPHCGE